MDSSKGQSTILVILIIGFLLAGAIFILTVIGTNYFLLSEVDSMVQSDNGFNQEAKDLSANTLANNNASWDNAFLWLVGGLLLGLFAAGLTLQNSPVIVIVVLVLLAVTAYAGMHVSNLYDELQTETVDTIDFQTNFPKSHLIMNNIVLIVTGGVALFGMGVFLSERIGL